MLIFTRRALAIAAVIFWLGGFTFYAAVVVPVGQDVLGSHVAQGMITRLVTNYLNLACAIALLPLAWDLLAARDPCSARRLGRWLSWAGILGFLAILLWLHPQLEALLDVDEVRVIDSKNFRPLHRWYLWLSTFQWACGLAWMGLSLQSWRAEDRASVEGKRPEAEVSA
jgi:hypothetical protein